jgi:hypothetical protein
MQGVTQGQEVPYASWCLLCLLLGPLTRLDLGHK